MRVISFVLLASLIAIGTCDAASLYFCIAPPKPCQSLTLMTSWSYVPYHLVINGHDYGNVPTSSYDYPNSVVMVDKIFKGGFE